MRLLRPLGLTCLIIVMGLGAAWAKGVVKLATTTSTEATGLLDVLRPMFKAQTGYDLHVIAVGTGKALKLGARGDVDVVWVHAPRVERAWMKQGHGVNRRPVMYNYFIIVGPASDPAQVGRAKSAAQAFKRIKAAGARFISRGDESGTHVREKALWAKAGVNPAWPGYKSVGQGMGKTLMIANEMGGYTLIDIGTWRAYLGKVTLKALLQKDPALRNFYSIIAVSPYKHPGVNYRGAMTFIAFVTSPKIQRFIGGFKKGGKPLFWPDAATRTRRW
jgi:tungstate transport system substrate-binding protein